MDYGDFSKVSDAFAGEISLIIILASIMPLLCELLSKLIDKEEWAKALGSDICIVTEKYYYYLPLVSVIVWLIFGLPFSLLKMDGCLIYTWIYFLLSGAQYSFFVVKAKKNIVDKGTKDKVVINNTAGVIFLIIFLVECITFTLIYLR